MRASEDLRDHRSAASEAPVLLQHATPDLGPLVGNLLELYIHELSVVFPVEIGPDGRFGYEKLPLYWSEPHARHAFLIRCGDKLAGFALVTRGSPASDDPAALDVAEFFVLRRFRRAGVGRRAAAVLWETFPGAWVVRVAEANGSALSFWRSTIASYTSGRFSEIVRPGDPHSWRVFHFASPNP
jgi:predicted acetyltransferase